MSRKPLLLGVLVAIALTLSMLLGNRFVLPVLAHSPYDIVILNGRVIDPETNFDGIRNVGIKDGSIATITEEEIAGDQTIDATNQVVAPGFIDLHAHGQNIGDYRMEAMQGVTTALELESGVLPIGDWYASQAGKHLPVNYGASAAWAFGRIAAFSDTDPLATADYFQAARELDAGATRPKRWSMRFALRSTSQPLI
ncbi:amidohydrolase family protein [bacterium]|nr:amidohydrolase family protein [bacterium]